MIFNGSEKEPVGFLDAVEVIVHGIDLPGDPCVPASGTFELFAEAEPEAHLRAVEDDDPTTLAVDAHHR